MCSLWEIFNGQSNEDDPTEEIKRSEIEQVEDAGSML